MSSMVKPLTSTSPEIAERRARRFWVGFICLLLGSNLGMGVFAIYLASSDPANSIIPNYYQKGLDWDKTKAKLAASDELGWSVEVAISPDTPNAVRRTITLTVLDRQGSPVEKGAGNIALFHHAHGKDLQELGLEEIHPGVYQTTALMGPQGKWDITLNLRQNETEFLWQQTVPLKWTALNTEGSQL